MVRAAYRILIVDDDPSIVFLITKMLEKEGYHTIGAENGKVAFEILENSAIDLVLSDISMPFMDGLEFMKRVKALKPHIPVIIMTGDANLPKVRQALHEGALDFLEKPFDLKKVVETIHRYESQRMQRRVVSLINRKFLLVASSDKKQRQLIRALAATQSSLTTVSNTEEAIAAANKAPFDLVVYATGEKLPNTKLFEKIVEILPQTKTIYVAETYDANQLNVLIQAPMVDSIVFKNQVFSEADFISVIRKLFSQDIFGIEKYMAWGFEPIQHTPQHTDDRLTIIETMSQYLQSLNINPRFVSSMENVADEFLTNALYNAPIDENGEPLYTDRTIGRACSEKEKCMMTYAYDGNYFGISMEDQFGSISKEHIFKGINRCLEEKTPEQKTGGAGLGLFYSFLTLNKFIINIRRGHKTEMIGLCDISSSMKNFSLSDKSLCIFVES